MGDGTRTTHLPRHLNSRRLQACDRRILRTCEIEQNHLLIRDYVEVSALVFVLEGVVRVTSGMLVDKEIEAGHFFLISGGNGFYGKATVRASLLIAYLDAATALCEELTLRQLALYVERLPDERKRQAQIFPIAPLLEKELRVTWEVVESGQFCYYFQKAKLDILLLHLRVSYTEEQLALFFSPIINENTEFKDMVAHLYPHVANANELILKSGLSSSTFSRRFQKAYGVTVGAWLTLKRKESILKAIMTTNLSCKQIAESNYLTPNYLLHFCKRHFGKTPEEIREAQGLG